MDRRTHLGRLGLTLLALGVIPPAPLPRDVPTPDPQLLALPPSLEEIVIPASFDFEGNWGCIPMDLRVWLAKAEIALGIPGLARAAGVRCGAAVLELCAANISASAVMEIARDVASGERFSALARLCVSNQKTLERHGFPGITDVDRLLGRAGDDPPELQRLPSGRLALRAPPVTRTDRNINAMLHPCGRCGCGGDGVCDWCIQTEAKEHADAAERRDIVEKRRLRRDEQAAARRARAAGKARRGW